ncbi:MAG: type IA DNA topoisomerase [Clostridia bacterium]|nr:type IA DNA topoisomerase [Clostridia bacterium]
MAKKVIVTEKPSVAMEFAKALKINTNRKDGYIESDEWIITWCYGHLVTMSYPEVYDEKLKTWRLDTLPFLPTDWKYEILPGTAGKQFYNIQKILQREDIDTIYNAGDSGREGEYIQRLVYMMAHPNPNAKLKRVWIDSQTEDEILRGIREAKDLDEYNSLSDAAYLRAKEDYLIGINFSRLLSLIYARGLAKKMEEDRAVISIGRVMTCVLGLVVNREREIRNFKKVSFYKIRGAFQKEESNLLADWKAVEGSKLLDSPRLYNETGFKKKEDALKFIDYLKGKEKATVESIQKKKNKENPPLLFNLAEAQHECTRRFKISPDQTLQTIQNLYEKKLVTYPRTDARVLSSAVAKEITKNLNGLSKLKIDDEITQAIQTMAKEKYSTKLEKTKYVDDSKITDHYAIIPTGQGGENLEGLTELEKNVYILIVKRFLAIFYPPAEYNRITVTIDVDGEKFFANGKVCTQMGYLELYKNDKIKKDTSKKEDKSDDDEEDKEKEEEETLDDVEILSKLKKGDVLIATDYTIREGETKPPKRYNSGDMVLAMENAGKLIEDEELREQIKGSGIGTSATRAEIIKKLIRINYIAANSKTQILTPTKRGEAIYDIVASTMPDMLNPELTASWEKGLTMVEQKEISADEFMDKLEAYVRNKVVKFKKSRNEYLYGY